MGIPHPSILPLKHISFLGGKCAGPKSLALNPVSARRNTSKAGVGCLGDFRFLARSRAWVRMPNRSWRQVFHFSIHTTFLFQCACRTLSSLHQVRFFQVPRIGSAVARPAYAEARARWTGWLRFGFRNLIYRRRLGYRFGLVTPRPSLET
jgi:hypothetical protein